PTYETFNSQVLCSVHGGLREPGILDDREDFVVLLKLLQLGVEDVPKFLIVGMEGEGTTTELLFAVDDRNESLGRLEAIEVGHLGMHGGAGQSEGVDAARSQSIDQAGRVAES